jgi:hypothetical protein
MKNRPPGPSGLKALEKTVVIKGGPQSPGRAPVAPAKGAPVPPPALWNYEHKEGAKPPSSPSTPGATPQSPPEAVAVPAAPEAASAKPVDAELEVEEMLAVMETNAALDELDEHIAALEDLVSRLPE